MKAKTHPAPKLRLMEKIERQVTTGRWSPKMVAILGYIFSSHWTDPHIVDLNRTSDGYAISLNSNMRSGFIGTWKELTHNLVKVADSSDLTGDEMSEFVALSSTKRIYLWPSFDRREQFKIKDQEPARKGKDND